MVTFWCQNISGYFYSTTFSISKRMNGSNHQQNGHSSPPQGLPVPAHDLLTNGSTPDVSYTNQYGANPPPGWSNHIGPAHKAPPPVATQLVVPSDLSDTPVTLTCYHCQHHVTTTTKTGPSTLSWLLCGCMCIFLCWPFCLVPFCCPPLNVTEHYCAKCNRLLGKYKGWKKSAK